MLRLSALKVLIGVALLGGCTDGDPPSRDDLPEERVDVDVEGVNVVAFPDRFPNVAWRCVGRNGIYTTTNRKVLLVVNDPNCTELGESRVVTDPETTTTTQE